jgi:endonuclease YncB( thermonuclease family)
MHRRTGYRQGKATLRNLIFTIALLTGGCPARAWNNPQHHVVGDRFTGVAHVVDGDTIHLADGDKIRIFGIDAPEHDQICDQAGSAYACGLEAAEHLRMTVEQRAVTCVARAIDRYHRTVASCSVDGKDVGAEMVLSGHAIEFRRYTSVYDSEEMAARNAKRGLWAGQFTDPSDFRRMKREGRF